MKLCWIGPLGIEPRSPAPKAQLIIGADTAQEGGVRNGLAWSGMVRSRATTPATTRNSAGGAR